MNAEDKDEKNHAFHIRKSHKYICILTKYNIINVYKPQLFIILEIRVHKKPLTMLSLMPIACLTA